MFRRTDSLPQHYNRKRDKVTLIILIVALTGLSFLSVGTYLALEGSRERDEIPAMVAGSGGYMATNAPTSSPTFLTGENQSKTDDSDKIEANDEPTKTDDQDSEQVEGQTTTDTSKENEKTESPENAGKIEETLAPTVSPSIENTSSDGTKATPSPTPSQTSQSFPESVKETISPTPLEEELQPTEEEKIEGTSFESYPASMNVTLFPSFSEEEEDASIRENSILDVLAEESLLPPATQAANWLLHHDSLQVHLESDPIQSEGEEGIVKVSKEKIIQRYVLAVLYYSLEMDDSELAASNGENVFFLSGVDECEWQNVVCNDQGFVTSISISEAGLSGTLPDELSHLTHLQGLDFHTNEINGTIPKTLKDLKNLSYIDFSNNYMTGAALPKEILRQDSSLQFVYLSNNRFSGTIAQEIRNLQNLRYLWLDNNGIEGKIPWNIGELESLEVLILSYNYLEQTIPRSLRFLPNLSYMDLSGNYLGGKLTRAVYEIPSLQYLYLNDNEFRGTVPPVSYDVGSKSNLLHLWLNENLFNGTIPTRLGRLTKLESLLLQGNNFKGEVPDEICELRQINLQNLEIDCSIECSEDCCTYCT